MSVSGILQVVVVPLYRAMLKFLRDDKFAIFAQNLSIFYQSELVFLEFGLLLDRWIFRLSVGYFLCCEWVNRFFFAAVGEHKIHG